MSLLDFAEGARDATTIPPFHEGTTAEQPLGVLFQAPWTHPFDGFQEHGRRCARALALTGCPVHLRDTQPNYEAVDPELYTSVKPLIEASIARYSIQVHHVVPEPGLFQRITSHRWLSADDLTIVNAHRVISTVWERWPAPADDVAAMNRCGQVWVACPQNAARLIEAGVAASKVRVVPIPYFATDPHLALQGRTRTPGPVRFYHIGKWEPRKAQDKLIEAWLRAVRPGEAVLFLKTSPSAPAYEGYPRAPADAVLRSLEAPEVRAMGWTAERAAKALFVTAKNLPAAAMRGMHRSGDVYVTLSRGEGFDMPAYDAALSGNAVVHVPSGGPESYCSATYRVPTSGTVPTHPFYGWPEGSVYHDWKVEDAVEVLRRALRDVADGTLSSSCKVDAELFSAEAVGRRMLENLRELVAPHDGAVFV